MGYVIGDMHDYLLTDQSSLCSGKSTVRAFTPVDQKVSADQYLGNANDCGWCCKHPLLHADLILNSV
jgi:hypothetical protein